MKKENHIKMRFSTNLLCCLAILLCTAAYGAHSPDYTVEVGDVLNVGWGMEVERIESDYLMVKGGTVNLYPGAYVDDAIYAADGSVVNIYAGELGADSFIMLLNINLTPAVVTVYGTGFAVDWDRDGTADPLGPSETKFTPLSINNGGSVLKGTYKNGAPINLLFYSSVPIHLVNLDPEVEIDIDIKPGSDLNNINLKSMGVVPVAVLTTDGFDAVNVVPNSVTFAGATPVRWTMEDVDNDGKDDMLFHFKTENLELDENSTEATLTGMMTSMIKSDTTAGEVIQGTDKVCIKPQKKKK